MSGASFFKKRYFNLEPLSSRLLYKTLALQSLFISEALII